MTLTDEQVIALEQAAATMRVLLYSHSAANLEAILETDAAEKAEMARLCGEGEA